MKKVKVSSDQEIVQFDKVPLRKPRLEKYMYEKTYIGCKERNISTPKHLNIGTFLCQTNDSVMYMVIKRNSFVNIAYF